MPMPYYVSPKQVREERGSTPAFFLNAVWEV